MGLVRGKDRDAVVPALVDAVEQLTARMERIEERQLAHAAAEQAKVRVAFSALAERWVRETTNASSDPTRMILHDAYQRIIGLGPAVVPLILEELARTPDAWDWALHAITGEDPVNSDDVGDMRATAEAWLRWGREHGYPA